MPPTTSPTTKKSFQSRSMSCPSVVPPAGAPNVEQPGSRSAASAVRRTEARPAGARRLIRATLPRRRWFRGPEGSAAGLRRGARLGVGAEDHRRPGRLVEVEVLAQVAEDLEVLPDARPRVGPAVGLRVQPLAVQEPVLDELQVRVVRQRLM